MFEGQKTFKKKKRFVIKIIALFICLTLLPTEESRAALGMPTSETASSYTLRIKPSEFKIPDSFGAIEESYQGTNGQTIIYIQDAHDSLDAQMNIANLIDYFVKQKKAKTVFTEGYEGKMPNDEYFGFIKDRELKRRVSYFLMDQLRVGGTEFAHINRCESTSACAEGDFDLIGADSFALHHQSVEFYRKAAEKRSDINEDVALLEKYIKNLADQYFPKELKEWMKWKVRLDENQMNLFDYLNRVLSIDVNLLGDETLQIPQIRLIFGSEDLNTNQEALAKIQAEKLFKEIWLLEERIAEIFLHDERDVMIFKYYEGLGYLKKLNTMTMTYEEYEIIREVLKNVRTAEIADFVRKHAKQSLVLKKAWEEDIENALAFYELTAARDLQVVDTLKGLDGDLGVLVFGGFHQENLKRILKEHGYSYHVVIPKINELNQRHQDYYRSLMSLGYEGAELPELMAKASKQPTLQAEIRLNPALRSQWDLTIREVFAAAKQTASRPLADAITEIRLRMKNGHLQTPQFQRAELRSDSNLELPLEKFIETRLPLELPQDYLILVPTFNEQKNISTYVERTRSQAYLDHVIYVDDASKDETLNFLREDSEVHFMGLKENHQKEGALYQAILALQQVYEERGIPFPKTFISVDADSFLRVKGSESVEKHLTKVIADFEKKAFNMRGIKIEAYLTPNSTLWEWVEGLHWYFNNFFGLRKFAPGGAVIYSVQAFQEVMTTVDFDFERGPLTIFEGMKKKGAQKIGRSVTSLAVKTEVFPTFLQLYQEKEKWARGFQKTLSPPIFKAFILLLDLFLIDMLILFSQSPGIYLFFAFVITAPLAFWKSHQSIFHFLKRPRTQVNFILDAVLLLPLMMATYNVIYLIHLNALLIKKKTPSILAESRKGKKTNTEADSPPDSPRHELRLEVSEEAFLRTDLQFSLTSQRSDNDRTQAMVKDRKVSVEALLEKSIKSPASFFIHASELADIESDVYKDFYALADQIKGQNETNLVVYDIPTVELSAPAWKELRSVGIKTLTENLEGAFQRYGKKQMGEKSLKHNVHFSTIATRLKSQPKDALLPFLSIGFDLPAALLFARSGGRMPGIQKRDGVYSVFDTALMKQLRAYQAQLVIAIAA